MLNILVIKTSALGDVLQVFPCIREIKRLYPDAKVDWVIESSCYPLARTHPLVDSVIEIHTRKWRRRPWLYQKEIGASVSELRSKRYDVLFDFQGNLKSALIALLAKADLKIGFGKSASEWPARLVPSLKVDPAPCRNRRLDYLALVEAWSHQKALCTLGTDLMISHNDERLVHQLMSQKSAGKNVMVCPFSRWPNKSLRKEDLLLMLKKLEEKGSVKFWIPFGHHSEKEQAEELMRSLQQAETLDALSIPALQRVMKEMDLVVAMDSFSLSLAGESLVPTYAFFGPSLPLKYNPPGDRHAYYFGACPYDIQFEARCPRLRTCKTGNCLHALGELPDLAKYCGLK